MTLLEERTVDVSKELRISNERSKKLKKIRIKPENLWQEIVSALFVLIFSFAVCGLGTVEQSLGQSVATAIQRFNWLVLVKGDSLQVDEVGRFLKQLPGASETTFISSQQAFSKLQADPLYFSDLSDFEAKDLPSSWRVSWEPDQLDFSLLDVWADDVRHLPSVVNVVFDPSTVVSIKEIRSSWFRVRLVLATFFLGVVLFSVILAGRFLFFSSLAGHNFKKLGTIVARDAIWWVLGAVIVFKVVGSFPILFWFGGLAVGLLHTLWMQLEKSR